jgi:glycyl-tRNA synthetase beta chain
MKKKNFLMEIKVENIPSNSLKKIALSLYLKFIEVLKNKYIFYEKIKWFATPRRLAIQIQNIKFNNRKKNILHKGPSVEIALNNRNELTEIGKMWAKKFNIPLNKIKKLKIKNKEWISYKRKKNKTNCKKKLAQITKKIIYSFSNFNFMRWNEKKYKFIRPIRNIIMMMNEKIIPYKICGLKTNNSSQSYSYNIKKNIKILHAKNYSTTLLNQGKIIVNYQKRKKILHKQIIELAKNNKSYLKINKSLLEEANSLIEYPNSLIVHFKKKYLFIPKEINIYIIEKILKSFPLFNKYKKLKSSFIVIVNMNKKNYKNIILGYQSVISSKLQDVCFFLKQDMKKKLKKKKKIIKKIIFYKNLGTIYDKTNRLKKIITLFSKKIKFNIKNAIKAASLSKYDLATNMVNEFPGLQGIIGAYYLKTEKINKNIYKGIKEHYLPKNTKDKLPKTSIGIALSISDKLDNIVGMFIIGNLPKGDKDPFGLRRAAIGIIKIVINNNISFNLNKIVKKIIKIYNHKCNLKDIKIKIINFLIKRFNNFYYKEKNIKKIIKSVLISQKINLLQINKKIKMILNLKNSNNYKEILTIYKRIDNILKKKDIKLSHKINKFFLKKKIEIKLVKKIKKLEKKIIFLKKEKKYNKIISEIIKLKKYIKFFFKNVKINYKIKKIKINRLNILYKIKKIFSKIANFSYLY